jgi:hypothetical protein
MKGRKTTVAHHRQQDRQRLDCGRAIAAGAASRYPGVPGNPYIELLYYFFTYDKRHETAAQRVATG